MDYYSPTIKRLQEWHEKANEEEIQADFSNEVGAEFFIYISNCGRDSKTVTLHGFIKHLEKTAASFGLK
ncbi:hypothetical protein ACWGXJ_02860 [Paenibacillus sp. S33]